MRPNQRATRAFGVLGGIVAIQFLLYGSSLLGRTLLLPLDLLPTYLPGISAGVDLNSVDPTYADLVLVDEVMRVRAVREIRTGNIPLWDPDNFAGAPFVANNVSAVFSPYRVLDYLFPGPVTVAWTQLLRAIIAGGGAYLFFRQGLRVRFWPATVGAWCYPLTGYFVLWAGLGSSSVVSWMPWILLAVDRAVRRPAGAGGPCLAVVTAFVLLSGHLADGALVLLVSGIFGIWRLATRYGVRRATERPWFTTAAVLGGGWLIGVSLAAPQILPTLEYINHSYRMAQRNAELEERPSLGLAALPQLVIPYFYGTARKDQVYLLPGYLQESAAAGYAGLTTVLFFTPLAFVGRRRREAIFWSAMALLGAAWTFGIPGFSLVAHLPVLRLLTFNRFMFLTSFALLTLGVIALDTMARRQFEWRRAMWLPVLASGMLAAWCFVRLAQWHEGLQVQAGAVTWGLIPAPAWFVKTNLVALALCLIIACAWLVLRSRPNASRAAHYVLALVLVGEMMGNAYGGNAQCDPYLYYPEVPFLTELARRPRARICGQDCLPPMLNQMYGLRQIRGYDGVDPLSLVELVLADDLQLSWRKKIEFPPASTLHHMAPLRSPIHDLLGVRYLIFRNRIYQGPAAMRGKDPDDFALVENLTALPRAFVPRRVVSIADPAQILAVMRGADFRPSEIAFISEETPLAGTYAVGTATITRETTDEVVVSAEMQSPGLVVLTDWWYPGWHAYLDGREQPILHADYALRGVEVDAGDHELIFRYEPQSFARGVQLASVGAAMVLGWYLFVTYRQRRGGRRRASAQAVS